MNNESRKIGCQVAFQGDDWENIFTVKSPSGRSVQVHCNGKWGRMSEELLAIVNKYQWGHQEILPWGKMHPETLTPAIMLEVLNLSK